MRTTTAAVTLVIALLTSLLALPATADDPTGEVGYMNGVMRMGDTRDADCGTDGYGPVSGPKTASGYFELWATTRSLAPDADLVGDVGVLQVCGRHRPDVALDGLGYEYCRWYEGQGTIVYSDDGYNSNPRTLWLSNLETRASTQGFYSPQTLVGDASTVGPTGPFDHQIELTIDYAPMKLGGLCFSTYEDDVTNYSMHGFYAYTEHPPVP